MRLSKEIEQHEVYVRFHSQAAARSLIQCILSRQWRSLRTSFDTWKRGTRRRIDDRKNSLPADQKDVVLSPEEEIKTIQQNISHISMATVEEEEEDWIDQSLEDLRNQQVASEEAVRRHRNAQRRLVQIAAES